MFHYYNINELVLKKNHAIDVYFMQIAYRRDKWDIGTVVFTAFDSKDVYGRLGGGGVNFKSNMGQCLTSCLRLLVVMFMYNETNICNTGKIRCYFQMDRQTDNGQSYTYRYQLMLLCATQKQTRPLLKCMHFVQLCFIMKLVGGFELNSM